MDRILVATDFSARSDRALRRATLIARRVDASIILVHVVDSDQPEIMVSAERDAAAAVLEATARTLVDTDRIQSTTKTAVDDIDAGILRTAEEVGAELIVLGSHRARIRDIFIGTTVERVVRKTQLPLLVAAQTPSAPYDKTLLALDFDDASKSAGRAALKMGIFEHTNVVVMHAFDTPAEGMMRRSLEPPQVIGGYVQEEGEEAVSKLRSLVAELGLPPSVQEVASIKGTPARTILESARSNNADLVVVGTNQRKGLERVFIGSVTEDIIRDAHGDILIIPG